MADVDLGKLLSAIKSLEGGDYDELGDGPSGAYQFTDSTWRAAGGGQYAPRAGQASKEQQDAVAAAQMQRILSGAAGLSEDEQVLRVAYNWYLGHTPSEAELDRVPNAAGGNKLTVREYGLRVKRAYHTPTLPGTGWGPLAPIVGAAEDAAQKAANLAAQAVSDVLGALVDPFVKGLKRLSIIGLATALGVGLVGIGAWRTVQGADRG